MKIPEKFPYEIAALNSETQRVYLATHQFLRDGIDGKFPFEVSRIAKIDTIRFDESAKKIDIVFNKEFGFIPFREENVARMRQTLQARLGKKFADFSLNLFAEKYTIEQLIPNFYREQLPPDVTRLPKSLPEPPPVVRNLSKPFAIENGLQNRHIAVWGSHGWYFDAAEDRWKWQRARVYQIVEDLLPTSFVQPYLLPMLENAGANVFMPRERDLQRNEVIVDVAGEGSGQMIFATGDTVLKATTAQPGFAIGELPYSDRENPFRQGSHWQFPASPTETATVLWVPEIPESGEYAVYVSYRSLPNSVADAKYTVNHRGGATEFSVNQQIGGGTWIYLGTFPFEKGINPDSGSVTLSNEAESPNRVITADALRFGGGMGIVSRNGKTSGRPRYMEGSRYYLQTMGMPDTLVYNLTEDWQNDYVDDYRSRGEWVNYLRGAPFGPNKNRMANGLNIPIDVSLAFHTDAGSTGDSSTIGTLMIVGVEGADSTDLFPDGVSRLASRDFGDVLQTQIVDDIWQNYNPQFKRRSIWDKDYSEAFRPNVPAALLELLSHHNFADMQLALDPRFRFDVSRSIYKAMLKFLATQNGQDFVVQPLPVTHFSATFSGDGVLLSWRPQTDPLEPTATPEKYLVYRRIGDGGFDNGVLVEAPEFYLPNLPFGKIYSFKIAAVNSGGESFPSEILAVCRMENSPATVLIVNGFDRISAPAGFQVQYLQGFADFWDEGVPDVRDIATVGSQIEFNSGARFISNESPGRGASHSNLETQIIAGNTHDFSIAHGAAIRDAGYSFVSVSDEAIWDSLVSLRDYPVVDLLLGEEKTTPAMHPGKPADFEVFPQSLRTKIADFLQNGGSLIVSGAHFASDLVEGKEREHPDIAFAKDVLKIRWVTNHAARNGTVTVIDSTVFPGISNVQFNSEFSEKIYRVEAPDAFAPADSLGKVVMRYAENGRPAAIFFSDNSRMFAFGFPLETVSITERKLLFKHMLHQLNPGHFPPSQE